MSRPKLRIEKKPDPKKAAPNEGEKEPYDEVWKRHLKREKERRVKEFLDAPRKAAERNRRRAWDARRDKEAKAEWNKNNPTRRERTGLSQKSLLRIDRKARMKAKEEAARRKNKGLPQLKHPGPLKPGEAEA